jgi:hypothetical protein
MAKCELTRVQHKRLAHGYVDYFHQVLIVNHRVDVGQATISHNPKLRPKTDIHRCRLD